MYVGGARGDDTISSYVCCCRRSLKMSAPAACLYPCMLTQPVLVVIVRYIHTWLSCACQTCAVLALSHEVSDGRSGSCTLYGVRGHMVVAIDMARLCGTVHTVCCVETVAVAHMSIWRLVWPFAVLRKRYGWWWLRFDGVQLVV